LSANLREENRPRFRMLENRVLRRILCLEEREKHEDRENDKKKKLHNL
jgi:hypothetical protein